MGLTNLQPDNDQIPKSNHSDLRRSVADPCFGIFDSNHVHEMEDILHRHITNEKAEEIHNFGSNFYV